MTKTAIFGGSFDPVHRGHMEIVKNLCRLFDRVIVVPSYISPFKAGAECADFAHRLNMLRLALAEEGLSGTVEISTFEIDRGKTKGAVSYTVDTVKHYSNPDELLFVVVGAEMLKGLHLWKDCKKLNKLAAFYVVPRVGFEAEFEAELPVGLRVAFAPFSAPDPSSSLIKALLAFAETDSGVKDEVFSALNKEVLGYINANGLYDSYKSAGRAFALFGLDDERLIHTYGTVKYALRLAKIHGVGTEGVAVSALLHDIAKNWDKLDFPHINEIADNIAEEHKDMPHNVKHAFIGARIVEKYFGVKDEVVVNAIRYHTTSRPGMSKPEKIIFLADRLEGGRDADCLSKKIDANFLKQARELADKDLDKALYKCLEQLIKSLTKRKLDVYYLTLEALKYYADNENLY